MAILPKSGEFNFCKMRGGGPRIVYLQSIFLQYQLCGLLYLYANKYVIKNLTFIYVRTFMYDKYVHNVCTFHEILWEQYCIFSCCI